MNADTDGDGLDDAIELYSGFDPLNINPDGDSFSDAEEYARDSDPFYYDLTGWEYAAAVVAGFTLGDAGQNMVDLGWLNPAYLQSFGYIGGWLASGFFVIGDIRDTLASLVRGDIADTFLNAIGLIPLLGDGTKVVRVVGTYLGWLSELKVAMGRWLFKQFEDAQPLRIVASPLFGYTDEITVLLTKSDADELIAKGNDLDAIKALTARHPGKLSLSTRLPDMIDWEKVDDARKLHWPNVQGREFAQAESTEAAVEYLKVVLGYNVLFVGSRKANYTTGIQVGPDIVAENPVTGKVVVIEVKGSNTRGAEVINKSRMEATVGDRRFIENSLGWLETEDSRYLTPMMNASDPDIQRAATLLQGVTRGNDQYETVIFGSGLEASWGGGLLDVLTPLLDEPRITAVDVVKMPRP